MRHILLATSATALVLTFAGQALANPQRVPVAAAAIAPPDSTTANGLLFSKDAAEAKPIDPPADAGTAKPEAAEPMAAPALSAEDSPIADKLRELVDGKFQKYVPREQDRAGVLAFYKARNFAPLWIDSGKTARRTEQARSFFRDVAADGLDSADYPMPAFDHSDPAKLAADELAMTGAVISFARHASIGRVAYSRVSGAIYFDHKAPGATDVLGKMAESADAPATLDAFNPQTPQYKALKAQLAAIRGGKTVDANNGAHEAKSPITDSKAKKGHDAKADAKTVDTAKPLSADTILANMERWRWMPHDIGATYVMVNIPDYTLKVVQDGKTLWTTRIVVGKVGDHATPLLTETMKYITVNPTWNVPPSIIRNEYLPALARDPGALARIGLTVSNNPDGSIRIFQPPGERNALGRIRFNFPNRFLVYQHDTPDKKLFALPARAFSHGCMRVQNPDQYAEVLLGVSQPDQHFTAEKIRAMYGSNERTITFKKPIPVYVTYQTAYIDDAGKPQARTDIYGLDSGVLRELHGDRRTSETPVTRNYNSSSKPVMSSATAGSNARGNTRYPASPGYLTWDSQQVRNAYQTTDRNRAW